MPAFFQQRGLGPEQLGVLFAAGTAIRLFSGPLCGRLADLTRARREVLAICAGLAAAVAVSLLGVALHGLTFAALHLACMRVISTIVPSGLAATAQAMYALGAAAATALLTLASGALYARLGGRAFLMMALLCAAAIPVALGTRGRSAPD